MPRYYHGAAVVFKGPHGPRLAAVVAGPWEDGSYDLDCHQRVRADAIIPFPDGELVEYHSSSMNSWIPARLLRQGQRLATFDLDCKDGVEINKIRLPPPHGGKDGGKDAGKGPPMGPPKTTFPLQAGEICFYKSSAHGWIPAKVQSYRPGEQTCDLDVKPSASVDNVFRLQDGTVVEYHSASSNSWIAATLLNKASEPGTFDLDCKMAVPITKIRPPPDATGGLQPAAKHRSRGGAAGATMGFFDWWGGGGSEEPPPVDKGKGKGGDKGKGKGYEGGTFIPSPAGGTTADVRQGGGDWSMFGGYGWGGGPRKASLWRYCPQDGRHLDIRSEPNVDGARSLHCLAAGDAFCVSQEKPGLQGVLYLELADGRGWVFDHKPGFGKMCEKITAEEEDTPGVYDVIHERLEVTKSRASAGGDMVGKLTAGTTVKVMEVAQEQGRVRARTEHPEGWITLFDSSTGLRHAVRSRKPPPQVRAERNACSVWGRG